MSDSEAQVNATGNVDPAAGGSSGEGELAELQARLAEAEARANQEREQLLRLAAEMENVRKRAARDMEQAQRFALERFAGELLAVADSLEMAASTAANADAATLAAGQEATLRLLQSTFGKFAIQRIDPQGQPFDPERHEAMAMQPSDTAGPGSVLQVVQTGYELNGRLLRPARVIVARAPDGA